MQTERYQVSVLLITHDHGHDYRHTGGPYGTDTQSHCRGTLDQPCTSLRLGGTPLFKKSLQRVWKVNIPRYDLTGQGREERCGRTLISIPGQQRVANSKRTVMEVTLTRIVPDHAACPNAYQKCLPAQVGKLSGKVPDNNAVEAYGQRISGHKSAASPTCQQGESFSGRRVYHSS